MFVGYVIGLLCLTYASVEAEVDDSDLDSTTSKRLLPDVCYPKIPKGRVPWIIYHRQPDSGWKEHTHRANIALAVNEYTGEKTEMDMMELQLEVEIANALLGNKKIHDNDLALYIHALIATSKNPRNFHGKDLVADLLARASNVMKTGDTVHPFLVLALCNSDAVQYEHLLNIRKLANHQCTGTSEQTELQALALKAYSCAAGLKDKSLDKFGAEMKNALKCLTNQQTRDGNIGNAYTTALAVQALIASPETPPRWSKSGAIAYLEIEAERRVNMIKAYYIELALNAERVKIIKDLYKGPPMIPEASPPEQHFVHYTVRADSRPHIYHTISIQADETWTLYDLMKRCVQEGPVFKFSKYDNKEGLPMIYSVSGIPNDAEENMFWRICMLPTGTQPSYREFKDSPKELLLSSIQTVTFWYKSTTC